MLTTFGMRISLDYIILWLGVRILKWYYIKVNTAPIAMELYSDFIMYKHQSHLFLSFAETSVDAHTPTKLH